MTLTTTKPAALRNRVRVTNKTRLRIFRNPRDDDIGHGDDGEAAEGISTAGVDLEDAKVSPRAPVAAPTRSVLAMHSGGF
jgi:hypothetical protein